MYEFTIVYVLIIAYILLVPISKIINKINHSKTKDMIKEYSIFIWLFLGALIHYLWIFPFIILIGGLYGFIFKKLLK